MQNSGVGVLNLFRASYIRTENRKEGDVEFSGSTAFILNMRQWLREMISAGDFGSSREEVLFGDKKQPDPKSLRETHASWGRLISFWGFPSLTNILLTYLIYKEDFVRNAITQEKNLANDPQLNERSDKQRDLIKIRHVKSKLLSVYILTPILLCIDILWFGVFIALKLIRAVTIFVTLACVALAELLEWGGKNIIESATAKNYPLLKVGGYILLALSLVAHCARIFLQQIFQPVDRARLITHEVTEYGLAQAPTSLWNRYAHTIGKAAGAVSFIFSVVLTVVFLFTPLGWPALAKSLSTFINKFSAASIIPSNGVGIMGSVIQDAPLQTTSAALIIRLLPDAAISVFHACPAPVCSEAVDDVNLNNYKPTATYNSHKQKDYEMNPASPESTTRENSLSKIRYGNQVSQGEDSRHDDSDVTRIDYSSGDGTPPSDSPQQQQIEKFKYPATNSSRKISPTGSDGSGGKVDSAETMKEKDSNSSEEVVSGSHIALA